MKKWIPQITLNGTVHSVEDGIITLSGPALAVSGIIAGIDLVTGGHVLQSQPVLTMAWAICLLLTLDFQVLALGARAHQVYISEKPWQRKAFEILLAILVAGAISYVSVQMQSIIARVNSSGVNIDTAAAQLGINSLALIWERSALVLVLIFLSGWFRGEQKPAWPGQPIALQQITPDLLTTLVEQLDARNEQRIEAVIEQVLTRVTITQQDGEIAALPAPAAPALISADGMRPETAGNADERPVMLTHAQSEKLAGAWTRLEAQGWTLATVSVNMLQQEAQVRREAAATWLNMKRREAEADSYADEPQALS